MKNKLIDLNDHLFAEIERLSDEDQTPEQIEIEVKRAGAIVAVSDQIIGVADKQLRAAKIVADHGEKMERYLPTIETKPTPRQIEGSPK